MDFKNSREEQFKWLASMGFSVVEYKTATSENIEELVREFSENIVNNEVPSDGLVLLYDDIEYGQSLGRTAKFPRDSIAFKWADEVQETTLSYIEWSPSRTGLINPVAVFEPVELEGTTVSRASVHNISILEFGRRQVKHFPFPFGCKGYWQKDFCDSWYKEKLLSSKIQLVYFRSPV